MTHNFWRRISGIACGLGMLALAGCAQLPEEKVATAKESKPLLFPPPPEETRFVFESAIYGSADVTRKIVESSFKDFVTGGNEQESAGSDPLAKPYAVAVHQGRIFVTDTVARSVKVFDIPEGRYFILGDEDPGRLIKPLGIDVDAAGNVYVADATAKKIMIYNRDGKFLRQIGSEGMFDRLTSVTVDKKGQKLYVVDIGGVRSENHRVRVLDAQDGKLLYDIGKRGSGEGEFNLPRDIAIGKDGILYVVDGGNFRVQVFDAEGKFLRTFGQVGKKYGHFARPKEVSTDTAGNLYVMDAAFGNFQVFDPEGNLLLFVGDRSSRDGPAQYMLPSGIFVDEDGRVFVVDQWFHKVEIYRPAKLGEKEGYLVHRGEVAK